MLAIGLALAATMPRHQPRPGMHYGRILTSMLAQLRTRRVLRFRSAYQALMFAAFNLFWTAAPLMLADRFGLSANAIALFALAGAGGALAAPFAGHAADRGFTLAATVAAMLLLTFSFFATEWALAAGALIPLVLLAILLDAAVQLNQVVTQRIIFTLSPEMRGRLNAIYMTTVFIAGALGSLLGTITYHAGGWRATAFAGGLMGLLMLVLFLFEQAGLHRKTARRR
jgi:predicted MFS family arabinose efflux permease